MPNPGVGMVSPHLAASLSSVGLFPQRITIEESTATVNTFGETVRTWTPLVNHGGLAARLAPGVSGSGTGAQTQELRRADGTTITEPYRIGLSVYCPAITTAHRVTVSGVVYDIVTVEHDAQRGFTWLVVERPPR